MNIEELGAKPIPGPDPTGQDARYKPEYAQLQAEIDKLNSVTQIEEVDWQRVVDLAATVLDQKAKDLLAAAYLSVALTQVRELQGLNTGLRILDDLVRTFWEDCFPPRKRMRGRVNAFSWWEEKTLIWLKGHTPAEPLAADLHKSLTDNCRALDQILGEVMPDLPPLRELLNILERLPVERPRAADSAPRPEQSADLPKEDVAPTQLHAVGREPSPESSPRPAESSGPESAEAARKALAEAARTFAPLARGESFADPWAWKASRLAAWINVKSLPPSQAGQTMIPAPDMNIKQALATLLSEGKHLDAARQAENHFSGAIFWLDLQRIIATALVGLGPDHAAAADIVRAETVWLLNRLPGLDELSFADGSSFADAETRAWIKAPSAPDHAASQGVSSRQDELVLKTMDQASERFAGKDQAGALDLISQAMRQAPDGPSRMRLRLGQMDLLCRAGRFAMAAALADELLNEVQNRGLEDWDPPLAVQVLLAAREAYVGMGDAENLAKSRALAARVSRIRPSAAMNLAI